MTEDASGSQRYPKRVRKPVNKVSSKLWDNPKRWSPADKELLHSALEKYGDQDLALLAAKVGNKSPLLVHSYLSMHKQQAAANSSSNVEKFERYERLRKWIEHIRSKKQKSPSVNPAALSMLMISLLEDHPVPTDSEVNFVEAYSFMFTLLSGRHMERWRPEKLSEPTLKFIKLTTIQMMRTALNQMDQFHGKFVESANTSDLFSEQNLEHLPPPVRRLVLHKHLNPLRLNEKSTDAGILFGSKLEDPPLDPAVDSNA